MKKQRVQETLLLQWFTGLGAVGVLALAMPLAAVTVVVDNDDGAPAYVETGEWDTSLSVGYNGGTYRFSGSDRVPGTAVWTAQIPESGRYEVYAVLLKGNNRTAEAPYTISHDGGDTVVTVSQRGSGISTIYLGEYDFAAGAATVTLTNDEKTGAYIADAIIFETANDDPPEILEVGYTPANPQAEDEVTAYVYAVDDAGINSVQLQYEVDGTPTQVEAHDDGLHGDGAAGDGVYAAQIPAMPKGTSVTFRFFVYDTALQLSLSDDVFYAVDPPPVPEYRSVWADTWGSSIQNPSLTEDFIGTLREYNLNTAMVEVRKIGDAYYDSNIEPRATNISGGADYDPLGHTIELAHDPENEEYVHVHAWFVMHRISRSEVLAPEHVLSVHPEYVMENYDGESSASGTIFLDPGHPGTVEWNVAVILDCMENYDIDGVNLDYIRYPEYSGSWGYNPVSIERFNKYYGKSGRPDPNDPDWGDWRRECVTLEVKKLYVKMWMQDPSVILTADTVNWGYAWDNWEVSSAYAGVYQDWVGWLEEGIIDYNALMSYSTEMSRHQGWSGLSMAHDSKRGTIPGIGAYLQPSVQDSMNQLLWAREAGADGLNIYDWGSEVNSAPQSRTEFYEALRTQLFSEWVDLLPRNGRHRRPSASSKAT